MGSQLLLRWDNHLPSFASSMKECLDDGDLTDLTISCQGRVLRCHKLVLSVASPHFKQLLKANPGQHPIVIMRDIPYKDMAALLAFIYQGEVTVSEHELPSLLKTAKALEVRGLADDGGATPTAKQTTPGRASHLEPEVVVKEEPHDPDDAAGDRPGDALTAIKDVTLLSRAAANHDVYGAGSSFDMAPVSTAPKTVSPCVVRLEKLDSAGGGGGGGSGEVTRVVHSPQSGDPAAGNLDDMLIPGTSALLDRILRRQLSLPDRGYFCPYCTREVNMRTLGKHMTKIHGGMRLQCKACREVVHTRVTSLLINHGICVLLMQKNAKLGDQLIRKLSRQIRSIYKNRRFKSQMLKRYPDLSYFCSSFIFGRVKQPCERCGLVLWSSSMASHLEKCGEDVIQCDFCNKHMARTRLPYHIDIYHPGKVIQMKEAEEPTVVAPPRALAHPVFGSEDAADETGSQIVQCNKCGKNMRQNNLRRHMRIMHPWKPSMRFEGGVDPATGLTRPAQDAASLLSEDEEEPLDGEEAEELEPPPPPPADDEPAETPDADNKYLPYKRCCPFCGKVMWKKYLASHVRSAHPDLDVDPEQVAAEARPPPGAVSKAKVIKHCPHCWKTMWRCNVKRHIRQVHPEHAHELTDMYDLEGAIRAAAAARGLPPPPSDEPETPPDEDAAEPDHAMLAIEEMNAMAEAEGLEALETETEGGPLDEQMHETVPTNSRRHEKNLKRCRYCRKLLRGCHLKRHILNWHGPLATGKVSTKTGVPGGLNPARQRTCPVCLKTVVVNNLRRHIRASHPEVGEEELMNVTDASFTASDGDESNDASGMSTPAAAPEPEEVAVESPHAASTGSGYANRRMRRCPHCAKVMVSSNMARHCKTHHPAEWRAAHGGAVADAAAAAAAAAEEMEEMNAEEAAAWLEEGLDGEEAALADPSDPLGLEDDDMDMADHPDLAEEAEDPDLAEEAEDPDLAEEAEDPDLAEEEEEHPDLAEEVEDPPELSADPLQGAEIDDEPADHPDAIAALDETEPAADLT